MKKLKHSHKLHGFTLVELIVVITLLAILGTIAFLSLQGYSRSARDSVRISNLSNLYKGLSLFHVVSGIYPMPEGQVTISASGTDIGYQGYAKDLVGSIAKLSIGIGQDPLDSNIYTTYSVNQNKTKMQLMSFLEDGGNVSAFVPNNLSPSLISRSSPPLISSSPLLSSPLIPTSFASSTSDYTLRTPLTKGDSLGILLSSSTGTLNQPVQENYSVNSFTGVDVVNTSSGYMAVFGNGNSVSGTGTRLMSLKASYTQKNNPMTYDKSLIGYWDMETTLGNGLLADLSGNGNFLNNSGGLVAGNGAGKIGNATFFDGTSKYFFSFALVNNLPSDMTVMSWVKTNAGGNIVTKTLNWQDGYALQRSFNASGTFQFVTGSGTGFRSVSSKNKSALDDTWQYVVGVHKDDMNLIYINGKLETTLTGAVNNLVASTGSMNIGSIGNGIHNFTGTIDEVRIYNRALSHLEIEDLYNLTK